MYESSIESISSVGLVSRLWYRAERAVSNPSPLPKGPKDFMTGAGRIELICGPMFSGKTTTLLDRLQKADATGRRVLAVKPARDDRYGANRIVSHTGRSCTANPINRPRQILMAAAGAQVLGIDEVHFWDIEILPVCEALKTAGMCIIAAGVDLDHRGQPFAATAGLERIADDVQRLTANCARCGAVATYTQRLIASNDPIVVGGVGDYEPRCEACFEPMA